MRVALNGWFWNRPETGSGQYLRRLITALSSHVPDSEFIIFVPSEGVQNENPNVRFVKSPNQPNPLIKVWWEQYQMPRLALHHRVDLLHIPYWAPPLYAAMPIVVTVHDLIPLLLPEYRGKVLVRLYTSLVCATTSNAALVLTDSESSKEDIHHHLRIPNSKIRAIHLAVDNSYNHEPTSEDMRILQELDIQPGYVLYLGGFDKRKNLKSIIESFAIVKKSCEDARLVVAGRLPQHHTRFTPNPRDLAIETGLSEHDLRFLGFVPESVKPALYRNARVFFFPSQYEGFGYPPLEALACGVPVVGSNRSSLPEVVGHAGILLEPEDVEGFASAIIQMLNDNSVHNEMKARAQEQAAHFSWRSTALQTFEAYKEAVRIQNT